MPHLLKLYCRRAADPPLVGRLRIRFFFACPGKGTRFLLMFKASVLSNDGKCGDSEPTLSVVAIIEVILLFCIRISLIVQMVDYFEIHKSHLYIRRENLIVLTIHADDLL